MRRGFSIFLILFFGLGPLSAMIDGSEDAGLPPCCRRHGAHHCAMYAQIVTMRARFGFDPNPAFEAPSTCPLYHGPVFGMLMPAHALVKAAASFRIRRSPIVAPVFSLPLFSSRPSLTHAGRGPPAANPS
jgi:hypothetical protein